MNLHETFCVPPNGNQINLRKFSPDERKHGWHDHDKIQDQLAKNGKKLLDLQYKLYAENRQSLLIVLQALDAAGKDGTINHVLSYMNPQGCRAQSFKVPNSIEASHDFLWREHRVAPRHGEVVIFNRSYYEDVLVGRVHGQVRGKILHLHLKQINQFEQLLHSNKTRVVKFFLHISKEEQLKRFGERLNDPAKHWKISEGDYKEREYWDDYMEAFNDAINHTSTAHAPWFVIPSNNKKFRNFAISEILIDTLKDMNPAIPAATVDIDEIRRLYHQNLQEQDGHKVKSDEDETTMTKIDCEKCDPETGCQCDQNETKSKKKKKKK
ncbi:MAG: polyphosphate kinase 2 family protein [Thermoguttaceae bacterium]